MVRCDRPAAFVWLYKLHTTEDHVLCHATVVNSTYIIKAEESRRLHVVYSIGAYYVQCIHIVYCTGVVCMFEIMLSPTTHREGLLRVGSLPCAPTYNRSVLQHVFFDRFGLAQPRECSSKAATCNANSTMYVASNN